MGVFRGIWVAVLKVRKNVSVADSQGRKLVLSILARRQHVCKPLKTTGSKH